jgi:hypothetical protein
LETVAEPTVEVKKKERVLTLNDRCDAKACGAAALVKVSGVSGELLFCGHHYNKYEMSENMIKFAFDTIDERWAMQGENRLKLEND